MSIETPEEKHNLNVPYTAANLIMKRYGVTDTIVDDDWTTREVTIPTNLNHELFSEDYEQAVRRVVEQIGEEKFEIVVPNLSDDKIIYRAGGQWKSVGNINPDFDGEGIAMQLVKAINQNLPDTSHYPKVALRFGFNENNTRPFLFLQAPNK